MCIMIMKEINIACENYILNPKPSPALTLISQVIAYSV